MNHLFTGCVLGLIALNGGGSSENQTPYTTPVLPPTSVPFKVSITEMGFRLPSGWQSGVVGTWGNRCILIAGRTNGLHGFSENPDVNNFPPNQQNTNLFVVDFAEETVWWKSLLDPSSGLNQAQIDTLSVTSPQAYQSGRFLYMAGGYGVDTATGQMGTKPILTAIDVPQLMNWVIDGSGTAVQCIRQTSHPLVQVTGGYMNQVSPHFPTLLIFGQNFTGVYHDNSNGAYTQQVRSLRIFDNGKQLFVGAKPQPVPNPVYRRRDLNVVPVMRPGHPAPTQAYCALSGVFTENGGIWTVPVIIAPDGSSFTFPAQASDTFKQGMNNYACPTTGLYSASTENMYVICFGGLTYGYFSGGTFVTDAEIPYTNQVTTVQIDRNTQFSQYLMEGEYPTILSTFGTEPLPLYFGAGAPFILNPSLPVYPNNVLDLDSLLNEPVLIGYIVGGIESVVINTTDSTTQTTSSPYIFQVVLEPR